MTEINIADIVRSERGRDKGMLFFVVGREDVYAYLCDGKSRRLEKPKRKKLIHMSFHAKGSCRTAIKIKNGEKVTNSEIRRSLAAIANGGNEEEGGM